MEKLKQTGAALLRGLAYWLAFYAYTMSMLITILFNAGILFACFRGDYALINKSAFAVVTIELSLFIVVATTSWLKRYLEKRWPESTFGYW